MADEIIAVNDKMKLGYCYPITAPMGALVEGFSPHFTPKEMLEMDVFEGKYCNDCRSDFPPDGFENAKTAQIADETLNYFGVKSRQPLSIW